MQDNSCALIDASARNAHLDECVTDAASLKRRIDGEHADARRVGVVELAHGPSRVGNVRHTPAEVPIIEGHVHLAIESACFDVGEFVFVRAERVGAEELPIRRYGNATECGALIRSNKSYLHGIGSLRCTTSELCGRCLIQWPRERPRTAAVGRHRRDGDGGDCRDRPLVNCAERTTVDLVDDVEDARERRVPQRFVGPTALRPRAQRARRRASARGGGLFVPGRTDVTRVHVSRYEPSAAHGSHDWLLDADPPPRAE